ncbi:TIGR02680 family protein [Nocardiopsis sp. MG754419]|uniref:TIGR02680 family protein n=1 Tax=Nocardiopsis sp. MG754419 TaxID=2259865 RepID=UPI001BA709A6|nr:TIGR02680 family protein [Nocardiopsis sp. MG754419]MBR8744969.1 TIGR02680 family protein [Nocardiopsis sp. MG754419]
MIRRSDRFRPNRAGIVNIWDYLDEEFAFGDGRLVLRGHNGSGKTKALEVLFPFILDGHTDARRLDPFSGQNRTMKSNLLYRGDESAYGYVWMEFARARDGEEGSGHSATETVTLIIGLRAHRHRDGVTPSFFVTDRRLGVDFGLLSTDDRPLTERQLKTVLGEEAHHGSAADYRRAVDARLFGLGDRYLQLLDLLLALRRPLLAKDLDPEKVSHTLTGGLSPLDETLIDQAARDFANLAAVQSRFAAATASHEAARAFSEVYSDYLGVNARHRLLRVEAATEQADTHARTVTEAAADLEQARADRERARAEATGLDAQAARLTAERDALRQHDTLRDQQALQVRRAGNEDRARRIATQETRVHGQEEEIGRLGGEAARVAERVGRERSRAEELRAELVGAAERSGIVHDAEGEVDTGDDLPETAKARASARRDDVDAVRERLRDQERAEEERRRADGAASRATTTLEEHEGACAAAEEELGARRRAAAEALDAWAQRWDVTGPEGPEALRQALTTYGEPGTPTLAQVFDEQVHEHRLEAAAVVHTLEAERERVGRELFEARRERDHVAAERDDAPPADPLRPAPREDRAGAPLWRLVRFRDDLPADHGAAIEGALHGAGLLTAWIHPDPELTRRSLDEVEADAHLLPVGSTPTGPTLADALVPETQEHVPTEVIAAVLAALPLTTGDEAPTGTDGVDLRGRFRLGPLVGAHPKPVAEFIGATNRAQRRRERLAEQDARIAALNDERTDLDGRLTRAGERLQDYARARTDLPEATDVAKAVRALEHHSTLLASARGARAEARRDLDAAVAQVDAERRRVRAVAAERAMPTLAEDVDAVAAALDVFRTSAHDLHAARADIAEYTRDLDARRDTVTRLSEALEGDRAELDRARTDHERETAELATLEAAIDAPARELLDRLERTEAELRRVRDEHGRAEKTASDAHDLAVRSETLRDSGGRSLTDSLGTLFEHTTALSALTRPAVRAVLNVDTTGVWPAPEQWPAPEDAARALVTGDLASVRATLPGDAAALMAALTDRVGSAKVSDGELKSVGTRMSQALRTFQEALGGDAEGYRVDHEVGVSGLVTVHVNDENGRTPVSAFTRAVAARVDEQGALLREEEQGVLEDELLGGIAQQIHERIRTAKQLVRAMDHDTRARPMSSGTRVGIRWSRSDGLTEHQRKATELVRRDGTGLGPRGLGELRGVLRRMIRDYHGAHPRAGHKQVLSAVLDYRTWYRFELRLAVPGKDEVTLTKNKHEQMSGGEKSAAIHLPLFAAANALYTSAAPTCPRVVALDEAFAGIDDRYKPELMGLTVTFDLDMFMTGHDLWVHYDSVPMAAHYDMHHDKASGTVSALLMLWDGEQTLDADAGFAGNEELAAELVGITPTRHVPRSLAGTLLAETESAS